MSSTRDWLARGRAGLRASLPTRGDGAATAEHDAAAPARDPVEGLERLATLHRSGALTDEEFAAAKRTLLAS